jgi:hypothetical protein
MRSWLGLATALALGCSQVAEPMDGGEQGGDLRRQDGPDSPGDAFADALLAEAAAPDAARADAGSLDAAPAPDAAPPDAAQADRVATDLVGAVDGAPITDATAGDSAPCVVEDDLDGDGHGGLCEPRDCSPGNAAIHPGATERCNALDDDCDGLVDEDLNCPAPLPKIWVFILAGQSNMVGLGRVSELGAHADLFAPALRSGIPKVGIYLEDSVHQNPNQNGAMRWLDVDEYGGFGVDAARFGPELGFGARMHELWPERQIRILKVAEGATDLAEDWAARSGRLYSLLLSTVRSQFEILGEHERIELVGLVWMQGESDAFGDLADAYGSNLRRFITSLREDLGQALLPTVAALIAPQGGWPEAETVRDATSDLAARLGPMSTVETSDLTMWPDDVAHYDTRSTLILGRRFADAAVGLLPTRWDSQADFGGAQGGRQWRYRQRMGSGVVEDLAYVSWLERWQGGAQGPFISRAATSPGAAVDAELWWRAPYAGRVQLDLTAAAVGTGGDGAWVALVDGDFVRWGPVRLSAGGSARHQAVLDVVQGRELRFQTAAGPAHDEAHDSTRWEIELVMSAVDE